MPGGDDHAVLIDEAAVERLLAVSPEDVDPPGSLSFARNAFVPLTTACRYTCTYCTYYDPPGTASLMSPAEVREVVKKGVEAGCSEALFTFGDDPDERYREIHDRLSAWGHDSIHSYLREAAGIALAEGLLPHANPGDQNRAQMAEAAEVTASMGVMLETTAEVRAHAGPSGKTPAQRLHTIQTAGTLGVPFTTGILVGIGEGWKDRAESLLAIADLHEQFGHIQEVIVQPVVDNERWDRGSPDLSTLRRTVAMARAALPNPVSVQVPPNLAPVGELIDCGVDDLGGVSPVTDDHVNPDHAWPALDSLREIADNAGLPLRERLPVYERYLPADLRSDDFDGVAADPPVDGGSWFSEQVRNVLSRERYQGVLHAGPLTN